MKKTLILNICFLAFIAIVLMPTRGDSFEKPSSLPSEITKYYAEPNFVASFSTPRERALLRQTRYFALKERPF